MNPGGMPWPLCALSDGETANTGTRQGDLGRAVTAKATHAVTAAAREAPGLLFEATII